MLIVMWLGYVLGHISSTFINYIQKLSYLDSIAILGDCHQSDRCPLQKPKNHDSETKMCDSETKMTDSATKTEAIQKPKRTNSETKKTRFRSQNLRLRNQMYDSETKTYDWETKMYDSETKIYDLETKTWLPPPLTTMSHLELHKRPKPPPPPLTTKFHVLVSYRLFGVRRILGFRKILFGFRRRPFGFRWFFWFRKNSFIESTFHRAPGHGPLRLPLLGWVSQLVGALEHDFFSICWE